MHPNYTLYSGYRHAIPGIKLNGGSNIISSIGNTTTPGKFDELIKGNKEYDFRHYISYFSSERTALHQAVIKDNYNLAVHLIEKFGRDYANVTDGSDSTIIFTAIKCKGPNSLKILKLLISCGANVNYPEITFGGAIVSTPLDLALILKDIPKAKLLIKFGAQQSSSFTGIGHEILSKRLSFPNFNEDVSKIFDKASAELTAETKAVKFQFFLVFKKNGSVVNTLPKELVAFILSLIKYRDIKYPSIRKKAEEMASTAIKKIE